MKQVNINRLSVLLILPTILTLMISLTLFGCTSKTALSAATSSTGAPGAVQTTTSPASTTPSSVLTVQPGVTVRIDQNNSLIFHIQGTVQTPGQVTVQYWSQGTGPFVTAPVSTNGTAFSVEVMRLRPLTQYNFQVLLSTSSGAPVSPYQGTFTTGPLPPGLQNASIQIVQGNPTYDLLLLDYNCTNFNGMIAIDGNGQIVWYYQNDNSVFTEAQEANCNLVFNEISEPVGYTMKEIAPDGTVIHSVDDTLPDGSLCAPNGRWNHEMLLRPDNKVWTIGADIRTVNISGNDTLQTGGTIEEWDTAQGTVTRLLDLFDLLDPVKDRGVDSDTTAGFFWAGNKDQYANETHDWTHSNSLDVLPNGDILMSNRHLDQIIAIKPDFSGIDWKLGGTDSDFTFPNPADRFCHQHYAHMLSNGNILLFDNGNLRPQDQGGEYSRGLELKLDFSTMQATKVWEYRATPDLFSSAVGSAIRLPNGNTVVDFGIDPIPNNPPVFTVVEADPNGQAVAVTKISSPGKNIQYRAIPVESLNGETTSSSVTGQ